MNESLHLLPVIPSSLRLSKLSGESNILLAYIELQPTNDSIWIVIKLDLPTSMHSPNSTLVWLTCLDKQGALIKYDSTVEINL